jgi:hypothetical protein
MDVTNQTASPPLPAEIRSLLAGLRWRIRAYVWLEGLAVALIWLGLTFWIGLGLDYLPVLAGANEMPRGARLLLLVVIGIILGWILYHWILRRAFVRLRDRSLALLLERRFGELGDSLITSVELARPSADGSAIELQLLADTEAMALDRLRRVRLGRVFNPRPLLTRFGLAALLVGAVFGFYATRTDAFMMGIGRLYGLRDEPWPRQSRIEVVGLTVPRLAEDGFSTVPGPIQTFVSGRLKVARGAQPTLIVQADGGADYVPEFCVIQYRTAEGDRGRVNMTRVGRIREGFQRYTFDDKPLQGLLSSLTFDVIGFDHRIGTYTIEVVDSPILVGAELECRFPSYLVDEARSQWLPRTEPFTLGTRLPMGTELTLKVQANKPLREVRIRRGDPGEVITLGETEIGSDTDRIVLPLGTLNADLPLEVVFLDTDGVSSERPHRLLVGVVEDQAPRAEISLKGVGSAVTPDVRIPLQGKVTDDYGVDSAWIDLSVNDGDATAVPLSVQTTGEVSAAVDFRELQAQSRLKLQPSDQLHVTVRARDKFNLDGDPHEGVSDHFQLDVVTPGELLSRLEARELGLRQRFEQIIEELRQARDALLRIRNEGPDSAAAAGNTNEPNSADSAPESTTEETATADSPAKDDATNAQRSRLQRIWSLRLLRAQRALLQSQKSAQESLGVADSFADIRAELENNRVDTEDRKERLQVKIADPLRATVSEQFPVWDKQLEQIIAQLSNRGAADPSVEDAELVKQTELTLQQADKILLAFDAILQNMLDIESYNELLDIVRGLIEDQERLMNETKKQQKKQVLDLLN